MRANWLLLFIFAVFIKQSFSDSNEKRRVSVSEFSFDSAVEDIQWCGKEHKTVFLKTAKGRLYKSDDSGRAWSEMIKELKDVYSSSTNSQLDELSIDSIHISPVDKNIILLVGNQKNHFISENAGQKFRHIKQQMSISTFLFHPKRSSWALLSMWTDGCEKTVTNQPCNQVLYFTKDLGHTFTLVQTYIIQFSWGDSVRNTEDKIYFTHHRNKVNDQIRFSGWLKDVDFSVMSLPSKSIKNIMTSGNKFLVSNGYIFVARLEHSIKQTVDLMVSTDDGNTFTEVMLPEELLEKSYTILDADKDAGVLIHVNHGEDGRTGTGNIYMSDKDGIRYTLSLSNNIRSANGECEFDKVASLTGVYISNFKDEELSVLPNFSQYGFTAVEKKKSPRAKGRNEDIVRTVISFDNGALWNYLIPPKVDSLGKPIKCNDENCFLHLHGVTNFHSYAPFYSVSNAAGIILGTGNIGSHLRYEQDEVNTYLSRDGGVHWTEIHKGAYIYELGDHGGLIVMADDLRKTTQVVFSWNEGQSWFDFDIGDVPLDVDNIVINPENNSLEFLLYGTRGSTGVLFHLDFSTLGQQQCKGVYSADSVSSDYETWIPTDTRANDNCVLGRETIITRKKQSSECYNGSTLTRSVTKKNCACQLEDYECELGFGRDIGTRECVPNMKYLISRNICNSNNKEIMLNAYRRIPGDTCVDGYVPEKMKVVCPVTKRIGNGAKVIIMIIFVIIVLLSLVTYSNKFNDKIKELLQKCGFNNLNNVKYTLLKKYNNTKKNDTQYKNKAELDKLSFFGDDDEDYVNDNSLTLFNAPDMYEDDFDNYENNNTTTNNNCNTRARKTTSNYDKQNVDFFSNQPNTSQPIPRLLPPPSNNNNASNNNFNFNNNDKIVFG